MHVLFKHKSQPTQRAQQLPKRQIIFIHFSTFIHFHIYALIPIHQAPQRVQQPPNSQILFVHFDINVCIIRTKQPPQKGRHCFQFVSHPAEIYLAKFPKSQLVITVIKNFSYIITELILQNFSSGYFQFESYLADILWQEILKSQVVTTSSV